MQSTDLNQLFSSCRTGTSQPSNNIEARTEYQRDYDRVIFSSAFRRLQNKTQVFPLPGSIFVHSRLTHSLEVSSVGRSFGNLIGASLVKTYGTDFTEESRSFYSFDFANVLATACLCHDIGNPAFGHAGEDAIAGFFRKNSELSKYFTHAEWEDLIRFEGNANAIRVLTQSPMQKDEGGLKLTYATLCSVAKYPCESIASDKKIVHRKKFGFFQSEKEIFEQIAEHTSMKQFSEQPKIYLRHPFVWLVEAADDICYNITDLEDAHRLGIIEHSVCVDLLRSLINELSIDDRTVIDQKLDRILDKNDKISYLRAKSIAALTMCSQEIYLNNISGFLEGTYPQSIFDTIRKKSETLTRIIDFSIENVYNHTQVVEIENAGYHIISELLSLFIPSIIIPEEKREVSDKKAIRLLPQQYSREGASESVKIQGVVDYISGMTDNLATDLYRRIKGIDMGMKM